MAQENTFWRRTGAFVLTSVALFPMLVALRVYEYVIVRGSHVLPAHALRATVTGLRADLALVLWVAAVCATPVLVLGRWKEAPSMKAYRVILVFVVTCDVALIQYFAVTFVPLGADLFGYSLKDIRETTSASQGVGVTAIVVLVIFGVATWLVTGLPARIRGNRVATAAFALCALAAVAWPPLFIPQAGNFASEGEFYLAHNTAAYFSAQMFGHVARGVFARRSAGFAARYPLLHKAADEDVLGPMFNTGSAKPNLVFVLVEGLGRDFVGEGARYGGFTPYLDSLTKKSIFFDNFLSTSGRTFGVLPGLFGSLPVVEGGLLALGAKMPHTLTLQKLLKERGYTTNYFTGTDGHFDNIDLFMEAQGVDSIVDASKFGAGYEKEPPAEGGMSWGYGDLDLFRRSFASIATTTAPRLDTYLTITTHEPFIPPRQAEYAARYRTRLASLGIADDRRAEFEKYANVFQSLLYLDDAVRYLIETYAHRADFPRTIFFITGDHRLVPIPPGSRLDRYRVPFIVYSPMLKEPHVIESVSSHQDVVPSVVAMLQRNYGIAFPDSVPWAGSGIDTTRTFRNIHSLALMRTKSSVDEYLDSLRFLSGDQLFKVDPGLRLTSLSDGAMQSRLVARLDRDRELGRVVAAENRVLPGNAADSLHAAEVAKTNAAFAALHLAAENPEALFSLARDKASAGEYDQARAICRKLLLDAPNYHDARALLGRSYAWQRNFDAARPILTELVQRAPMYDDGYRALANMEIWADHGQAALDVVARGLERFPKDTALLAVRRRALAEIAAGATP